MVYYSISWYTVLRYNYTLCVSSLCMVQFILDNVTRDCVPGSVREGLERACHTIPWSHDRHMTLDDPLWSQLDEFKTPEIQVKKIYPFS